jgi:hypothetical protein
LWWNGATQYVDGEIYTHTGARTTSSDMVISATKAITFLNYPIADVDTSQDNSYVVVYQTASTNAEIVCYSSSN